MGKEIDAFKAERNLALLLVVTKLPNFILALIAGIMSNSMIVWMEFVEITSIILPGILIALISRRPQSITSILWIRIPSSIWTQRRHF